MINYHGSKHSDGVVLHTELTRRRSFEQLPVDAQKRLASFGRFVQDINPDLKVFIFGSYATGREHENSDLDIFVEGRATDREKWEIKKEAKTRKGLDVHIGMNNTMRGFVIPKRRTGKKGCKSC